MPAQPLFRFDGENKSAQRVAERQAARAVTEISEETRAALRSLIARSIREGIPPYDAARMIQSMVGLTTQHAQAAANYRQDLIDQGHTLERVNTLTDRYAEKLLRLRAESIARTEVMDALNTGALEGWKQAKNEGLLSEEAEKEVIVVPDDRLCPICEPLDGQKQPLDKPFQTALGEFMMPPFHPRCRCTAAVNP